MQFKKEHLLLYAVTDRAFTGRQSLYEQIRDALSGGATMIQLREKHLDEASFLKEAISIKKLCSAYHAPLIINDNLTVALQSSANGIHVGAGDTPVEEIRRQCGRDFIIGATAKTVEQAKAAEAQGADYLGAGAVFSSPTKENAQRISKETLREICASVSIPVVAIGGIAQSNITELAGCGMCGFAVVSAIFAADDRKAAAEQLKRKAAVLAAGSPASNKRLWRTP